MDDLRGVLELLRTSKTTEEQAVCKVAFQAILNGKPLDPAGLACATDYSPDKIQALLDGLTARGLVVVESEESRARVECDPQQGVPPRLLAEIVAETRGAVKARRSTASDPG